jgi:hypothetical protein
MRHKRDGAQAALFAGGAHGGPASGSGPVALARAARVAQNGAVQRVHWQRSLSGKADHRLVVGERVQHVEVGP